MSVYEDQNGLSKGKNMFEKADTFPVLSGQSGVKMRGWSSCNRTRGITSSECQATSCMFTSLQQCTKNLSWKSALPTEYKHLAPNKTVPHKVSQLSPLFGTEHDTCSVTDLYIKYLQF